MFGTFIFWLLLVGLFLWNYKFVFNNRVIKNFNFRHALKKSEINDYIRSLKSNIHLLKIDEEPEEQHSRNNKGSQVVVRVIFSLVVSLGTELILLILGELLEFSHGSFFHLIIDSLVILVSIIVPLLIIVISITHDVIPKRTSTLEKVASVILFLGWLFVLNRFGHIYETSSSQSIVDRKISEIAIFGITIISILSGIGSASTIYKIIKDYNRRKINEYDLNNLISSYNNTNILINKRQLELEESSIKLGKDYSKGGGLLHKVQSFATLKVSDNFELTQEIDTLKKLNNSIYDDINKSLLIYSQQQSGATFLDIAGKYFNYGFAVYCIYRILMVMIKIPISFFIEKKPQVNSLNEIESSDALAITISKIISSIFTFSISENQLINIISFTLSGGLFLGSISNVLMTFKSFGKLFPIVQVPTENLNYLKHLFISQLLSIYIIATCLLIRINLPSNLSNQISKILSLSGSAEDYYSEIEFIDYWFDLIFGISVIATSCSFLIENNDVAFDEESFMEDKTYKFV
ncbi:hypothetical protein CLIB1444_14S01464 [[Candida] jaroonii]|uniref:Uncharacterized protein n=1 Tax=[Candida] jaroonii TaxID=467808 RepID=A0ACA9YE71_9ASCO|nr:hypothetical protein CLIB1444_14S01464 [[Candida] jaroonii]